MDIVFFHAARQAKFLGLNCRSHAGLAAFPSGDFVASESVKSLRQPILSLQTAY
jgi:hypothetical protein